MRKFLSFLLAAMSCIMMVVGASAAERENSQIIYLDDGAYIIVTVQENGTRASGTKSGRTVYEYYGADGTKEWSATLSGTFTYNGSSATCTSSSCSVSISNSAWYTISKTASKSGSKATASVTMGRKMLGVVTDKETIDLTLSCDADGNLS